MSQHRGRLVLTMFLALAVLVACSGAVSNVDRITFVNTTGYELDVHVTGPDREGWLPLALLEPQSERVVEEVIDQEEWIFRFLHWGDPVGEISFTRAALARGGWRVEVPPEIEDQLKDLGRPPSE